MSVSRYLVCSLVVAACAQTQTPSVEAPKSAPSVVQWDEAATAELEAYSRAEHAKWLSGEVVDAQYGVADDTALLYDTDPTGTPVRVVGPEAIKEHAATLGAFSKARGVKGTIGEQTCRATAEAGVCATELQLEMPMVDGSTLTMKRRATCLAARVDEEWRWAHCHVSPAERPDAKDRKLLSSSINADKLEWVDTPQGEMAVVWQNPATGQMAAFMRFKVGRSDSDLHFQHATSFAAVLRGRMTHWTEGGTMYEVNPGGFAIIPGGRAHAHTSEFVDDTLVFGVFDRPMNRVSTAAFDAGKSMDPPAGMAPWADTVTAELDAFVKNQMSMWDTLDVDGIAALLADIGLPSYNVGAEGEPVRVTTEEQIALAREMKAEGRKGSVDVKKTYCRGTGDFGWCAVDYDFSFTGPDGKPATLSFRGTGVAARQADGWKSIHWHVSMAELPVPPPPKMTAVNAEDLEWVDMASAPGAQVATVWQDRITGATAAFLKVPKRWNGMPAHFHNANLHYAVLEGSYTHIDADGTKRVTKKGGWGFEAAKNIHRTEGSKGLLLFMVTDGPMDAVKVDKQGRPLAPSMK